jgi:hypothetical protein
VIERIERLGDSLHLPAFRELESTAKPCAHTEEIVADSHISTDESPVHNWPGGSALDCGESGGDVQGQGRIILQHTAQLEAMTDPFPGCIRCLHRGTDRAVKDDSMPLVVVGPSVVLPDVEVVDRSDKKKNSPTLSRAFE